MDVWEHFVKVFFLCAGIICKKYYVPSPDIFLQFYPPYI